MFKSFSSSLRHSFRKNVIISSLAPRTPGIFPCKSSRSFCIESSKPAWVSKNEYSKTGAQAKDKNFRTDSTNSSEPENATVRFGLTLNYHTSHANYLSFLEMSKNFDVRQDTILNCLNILKAVNELDKNDINQMESDIKLLLSLMKVQCEEAQRILDLKKAKQGGLAEFSNIALSNSGVRQMSEASRSIHDILSKYLVSLAKLTEMTPNYRSLPHIVTLMIELVIIDLRLWKTICDALFLHPENFLTAENLIDTMNRVRKFMNRFHFQENEEMKFSRYHFIFKEKEITSLLNKGHFVTFLLKFEKHFIDHHEVKLPDKNILCLILKAFSGTAYKFTKASYLNFFEHRRIYKKIEELILKDIEVISPQKALATFSDYILLGINNDEFIEKFSQYILANETQIDKNVYLYSILKAWKYNGAYHKLLYKLHIKNLLMDHLTTIAKSFDYLKLPGLAYQLASFKLDDSEVWYLILGLLKDYPYEKLYFFQKKSLHLMFQALKLEKFVDVDLKPCQYLMNQLSKFCMGIRYGYDFNLFKLPDEFQHQLNCCDEHTKAKYHKRFMEVLPKIPDEELSSYRILDQIPDETPQEKLIKRALTDNLSKMLGKTVTITSSYFVCLYNLDLLIEIEGIVPKVALEISGQAYNTENGELLGKKKLKMSMLKKLGFLPVVLNISLPVFQNWLVCLDSNFKVKEDASKRILEIIAKEMAAVYSIKLNFKTDSKWTIPDKPKPSVNQYRSLSKNSKENLKLKSG